MRAVAADKASRLNAGQRALECLQFPHRLGAEFLQHVMRERMWRKRDAARVTKRVAVQHNIMVAMRRFRLHHRWEQLRESATRGTVSEGITEQAFRLFASVTTEGASQYVQRDRWKLVANGAATLLIAGLTHGAPAIRGAAQAVVFNIAQVSVRARVHVHMCGVWMCASRASAHHRRMCGPACTACCVCVCVLVCVCVCVYVCWGVCVALTGEPAATVARHASGSVPERRGHRAE